MKKYFPTHEANRMKSEGDVAAARAYFLTGKNRVLYHLIQKRFSWMNDFIRSNYRNVIELGCGAGLSEFFIDNKSLTLTDIAENEWVDAYQDALNLNIPDNSQDVVICSHMIHHLANPATFLDSVEKKLKDGGFLVIQDIYTGVLMKFVLWLMRHEGWSDEANVFDRSAICNDSSDPWSANCSIPKLLFFKDAERFSREFPKFEVIKAERNECLLFLLSGGVIAKTFYLPLNDAGANIVEKIDRVLVKVAPKFFACGCSVVLRKKRDV